MGEPKTLKVFYAWQSDLPDATNRRAIRNALTSASSSLQQSYSAQDLSFVLDEATRDVPGSPSIPDEILQKINACDIFVCDVTPINSSAKEARATPNPNVMFELGYAAAQLGWPRIITIFNEAYGVLPTDLPFDISRHRVSRYKLETDSDAQSREKLVSVVRDGLEGIIRRILQEQPTQEN